MGLLDFFMGNEGAGSAAAPVPAAPDDGRSLLQRYLLPDDMNRGTSDRIDSVVGAIGAGMLAGNRYQWVNPTAFAASLESSGKDRDRAQQRAALKLILKQSNPGLSDAQLDVMANDPQTAKLAMAAGEAQAGVKAGQQASGIMGGLFGGGGVPGISPAAPAGPAAGASLNGGAALPEMSGDGAEIQSKFVDTLKAGGLTNPFGLAAVAAYGQHESRYSPGNVNRTWSDPSESGQAGTSGGILSWRDDRLANMQRATQGADDPVVAQAQFTLSENPALTEALQRARSPEEANALMAKAWGFAGHDRPGGGEYAARLATTQSYANRFLGADGQRPTQVADASGAVPQPPGLPIVDSRQPGFDPNSGADPLTGFVPSTGQTNGAPSRPGMPDLRGVPPVGTNTSSPPPPAPKPRPGMRDPDRIAETEADTQALEGRMGMYPPSVYGITADAQGRGAPSADMPAPDARNAEFFIPPGGSGQATQLGRGTQPASGGSTPDFPLNDPKVATAAIPKLFQVLAIPNLPDAQKAQAKAALDYALNVVKPTQRTQDLMQAGFTPGTPEYKEAYKRQLSDNRPGAVQEYEYGRADPGFDAYRDRRAAKSEPQIAAQVTQRREAAEGLGLRPGSPGYQSYVLTGKMPNEDKPGPSAGDKKAIMSAEDELPVIDNTIASLARAKELNPQTYTGKTASYMAQIGTSGVPGAGIIADTTKSGKTREFGQLMSMEAIKSMSQTLKGATTDAEMGRFMEILGDPSTPVEIRGRTIDRMLTLAERQKDLAAARVEDLRGGTYYRPREQGGGQPARSPDRASTARPASAPPAGVPSAAANMLRQNPDLAAQFDAKYGAGASRSILGGR